MNQKSIIINTMKHKNEKLKALINDQNQLIKSLDLKVLRLEEKVKENNFTTKKVREQS